MNEIDKMVQELRDSFTYTEDTRKHKLVMIGFFSLLVLFAYWYFAS